MTRDAVAGRRVLVVEDEALIALEIESSLLALGVDVVGPTGSLATAMKLADDPTLDAAILDVNIRGGQKVYPVAELLAARGIPFILASGYGDWVLPDALRDQPRLTKPYTSAELQDHVTHLLRQPARVYDRSRAH